MVKKKKKEKEKKKKKRGLSPASWIVFHKQSSFGCWDQTRSNTESLPSPLFNVFSDPFEHFTPLQLMKAKSIRTPPLSQDPWFKGIYLSPKNTNGLREALFFKFDQKMFSSPLYMSLPHKWTFQNAPSQSTERLLNILLNKKQSQPLGI